MKNNSIKFYIININSMNNIATFLMGSVFGAYIAQTYKIPSVKKKVEEIIEYLNSIEK